MVTAFACGAEKTKTARPALRKARHNNAEEKSNYTQQSIQAALRLANANTCGTSCMLNPLCVRYAQFNLLSIGVVLLVIMSDMREERLITARMAMMGILSSQQTMVKGTLEVAKLAVAYSDALLLEHRKTKLNLEADQQPLTQHNASDASPVGEISADLNMALDALKEDKLLVVQCHINDALRKLPLC